MPGAADAGRASTPTHADAGRGALFRAYLFGRAGAYALVFPSTALFTFGAWRRELAVMVGGPVAVAGVVALIAYVAADRGAKRRFFSRFASSLGLLHSERAAVMPLTPLLSAGDRRWCEDWMAGRLPGEPELAGGVGHFVWEDAGGERGRSGKGPAQRHRFTLCVLDLEASMPLFRGVYLRPRRGVFAPHADWLARTRTRAIELESAAFTERYELMLADDHDEGAVRQLLAPTLVRWLAAHPLAPGFELRAGTLVVYVERALADAGNLTFLLDAARHLAARVTREVDEAKRRPAA